MILKMSTVLRLRSPVQLVRAHSVPGQSETTVVRWVSLVRGVLRVWTALSASTRRQAYAWTASATTGLTICKMTIVGMLSVRTRPAALSVRVARRRMLIGALCVDCLAGRYASEGVCRLSTTPNTGTGTCPGGAARINLPHDVAMYVPCIELDSIHVSRSMGNISAFGVACTPLARSRGG